MMEGGYFSRTPRQASPVRGLFSRGLRKLKALLLMATGGASVVPLQGPCLLSLLPSTSHMGTCSCGILQAGIVAERACSKGQSPRERQTLVL